ncbi:hypothetical protein CF326_g1625 [Tilletia indica]|nr:hypothetical protein CF326_g1625 [Tilletia indica]
MEPGEAHEDRDEPAHVGGPSSSGEEVPERHGAIEVLSNHRHGGRIIFQALSSHGGSEDGHGDGSASEGGSDADQSEGEDVTMEEQQCRICRSGAEDDAPLFRPCKCSGSIQYCHQDCLIEWLSHSHKKYCELCGHPFAFRKRYKSSLPKGLDIRWTVPFRLPTWMLPHANSANPPTIAVRLPLPAYLYARRMVLQALGWIFTGMRGITVLITWLVLLPLVNINVWRSYFWMSDTIVSAWESVVQQPIVPSQNVSSAIASTAAPAVADSNEVAITFMEFILNRTTSEFNLARKLSNATSSGNFTSRIAVPLRTEFLPVFRRFITYCDSQPMSPISPLYASFTRSTAQLQHSPIRKFEYLVNGKRLYVDISELCALFERTSGLFRRIPKRRPNLTDPFSFKLARLVAQTAKNTVYTAHTCSAAGPNVCAKALWKWLKRWTSVMSKDLVEGQVLTCAVIIIFVGVFLLREWVLQNLPQVVERVAAQAQALRQQNEVLEGQIAEVIQRDNEVRQRAEEVLRRGDDVIRRGDDMQEQVDDTERRVEETLRRAEEEDRFGGHFRRERENLEAQLAFLRERNAELLEGNEELRREIGLLEAEFERLPAEDPEAEEAATRDVIARRQVVENLRRETAAAMVAAARQAETSTGEISIDGFEVQPTPDISITQPLDGDAEKSFDDPGQSSQAGPSRDTLQFERRPEPGTPAIIQEYRRSHHSGMFDEQQAEDDEDYVDEPEPFVPGPRVPPGIDGPVTWQRYRVPTDDPEPLPEHEDEPEGEEPVDDPNDHMLEEEEEEMEEEEESDSEEEEEDEIEEGDIPEDEVAEIAARIGPAEDGLDEVGQGMGVGANGWEDGEQMGGLDEELDGMLEAIGMRGPMIGLLQNAALMVVLCSFALMLFVAVPYVAGRTFGFGTTLLHLATYPIKLVRMVTDPTFDTLIDWFDRYILRPVLSALAYLPFSDMAADLLSKPTSVGEALNATATAAANTTVPVQNAHSWIALLDTDKALSLLDQGRDRIYDFGLYLIAKTHGTSVSDRVLCVMLGHSYWLGALMLDAYFGVFQHSQQLQWLRQFVDMQRFIVKVLFFMIIELLIFPIGCGLVLDLCLSPLIESVTFGTRLQEALGHPLTFFFVRWVGGTLYMFGFAQWVGATRHLLRKGALSWIRDPNDPTFSPVREILERRTALQLKKIFSSAVMYAWLLIACVGLNLWFIRHFWVGVLPLRWRPFHSLSAVPFDLLMLYYGMPFCIRILRPGSLVRKLSRKWWARVAQLLRLSNFLLGKDAPFEQGYVEYDTWTAWFQRRGPRKADDGRLRAVQQARPVSEGVALEGEGWTFTLDGAFAHVPADDSPAPDSRVFIMVDREGVPVDDDNDRWLQQQDVVVANMTNKPKYEVVYLPPRFRLRIYALFFLLWLSISVAVQISIGGPLLVGRALLKLFTDTVQHDFYVWSIGCPVLAIPAAASYRIWYHHRRRLRRREQAAQGVHGPAEWSYTLRGVSRHAAVLLYFGVTIGVVIPFLIGMTTRVYLVEPWLDVSQLSKPVPVFQTWAMGLMEQVLFVRLLALQNDSWAQFFTAAIEQTVRDGVGRNVQPWRTTRDVIFPVLSILVLLLVGPPLQVGLWLASRGGPPLTPTLQQGAVRGAYKWFSFGLATAKILRMIVVRIDRWTMSLKDELFLESTELTNYTGEAGGNGERMAEDDDGLGAVGLLPDHFI